MRKIRRIYETTHEINFISPEKEFSLYWNSFKKSELGRVHQSIPWYELAKGLKIKEHRKGPDRIFSPQGMLALMFLISYVGCSDRKLISHLNGSIDVQMFCGIFLGPDRINNYKIVSEIRCQLAKHLDIKILQQVLAESWKPYLTGTNIMLEDTTCYETSMRWNQLYRAPKL